MRASERCEPVGPVDADGAHLQPDPVVLGGDERPVRSGHHGLNRRTVGQHRKKDVGARRCLCRRDRRRRPGIDQWHDLGRRTVPDPDGEPGRDKPGGHRSSHLPDAEDGNGGQPLPSGLLLSSVVVAHGVPISCLRFLQMPSGEGPTTVTAPAMMVSMRARASSSSWRSDARMASSMWAGSRVPTIATSTPGRASVQATANRRTEADGFSP